MIHRDSLDALPIHQIAAAVAHVGKVCAFSQNENRCQRRSHSLHIRIELRIFKNGGICDGNRSAEQIIRFSGFEPYKDIEIKFIGTRPGERLVEPLWLEEENPRPTDYKKILRLTNIPPRTFDLDKLVGSLAPICTFTPGKESLYRNKAELLKILRTAVPTLDEFYKVQEKDGKVVNMSNSVKVVL